ncbi:PucR family transcriptional regulator [Dactylosporangium sp. NPDC048998]|uniref:PucR family transcriptional regulator n=1 Tax=Dactylosporangium sp. NPDC048998 TaxID=3363976 RepID=UPI003717D1E5
MAHLTLRSALCLPVFRRAEPIVLAGEDELDRPIRWIHATELLAVGDLLRPGDLVLTMGTGMPEDDDGEGLKNFAQALADVDSAGLVVELGRRWRDTMPPTVVAAFAACRVPLVALTHEVKFAALTQAVGERIIDGQLAELREAQRVHETFTELSFTQAGPAEILQAVQRLSGGAVVLENGQHRPLDYLAGFDDMSGFLDGWQARSCRVQIAGRTGWDSANGWLITRLGTSEQSWGRLVISCPSEPPQRLIAVAERAAAALALHRLHDRDRDNAVRRTHRELLEALRTSPDSEEVARRCEMAEFPTLRRHFLGLVIRRREISRGGAETSEIAAATAWAAYGIRIPALVTEADGDVRVLLSVPAGGDLQTAADRLAHRLRSHVDVVVAAGSVAADRNGIDRSVLEAAHVADAVPVGGKGGEELVHRLEDLHLRGLLALLRDDERLRLFVDRELAPLRRDRDERGADLYAALRALVMHPASKTDAAASLHLSRAAFYDRLAKLEARLGVSLDDPDVRVSLHVALMADELSSRPPT